MGRESELNYILKNEKKETDELTCNTQLDLPGPVSALSQTFAAREAGYRHLASELDKEIEEKKKKYLKEIEKLEKTRESYREGEYLYKALGESGFEQTLEVKDRESEKVVAAFKIKKDEVSFENKGITKEQYKAFLSDIEKEEQYKEFLSDLEKELEPLDPSAFFDWEFQRFEAQKKALKPVIKKIRETYKEIE